jgi:Fur family ferric uptake transcriptional regulator
MARKARISGAILELMQGGARHAWTLEELHEGVAAAGAVTDFSSVFRAAEKLVSDGIVRKLLLEDGRARFELMGAHHDHLYCMRCRAIVPVPCVIEAADFAALERATGAAIIEHHLVLTGICRACRTAAPRTARRTRTKSLARSAAPARRRR